MTKWSIAIAIAIAILGTRSIVATSFLALQCHAFPSIFRSRSRRVIHANAKKKKSNQDDMFNWYDEVDATATPDDIFREEMQRQKLLNQIGGPSNQIGGLSNNDPPVPTPGTNTGTSTSIGGMNTNRQSPLPPDGMSNMHNNNVNDPFVPQDPSAKLDARTVEATLAEYSDYMVPDNWLNDELALFMEQKNDSDNAFSSELDIDEQNRKLEQELEEMETTTGSSGFWQDGDEPWDHFGQQDDDSNLDEEWDNDHLKVGPNPNAAEFLMQNDDDHDDNDGDDELAKQEAAQEEAQYLERLLKLKIKSARVEKATNNSKAAAYFQRAPDEIEGYDRMWVSAIDNACFKNLVGMFRNYGVQFADNFGDWEDGDFEDGFATIEEIASFKARKVYEITGLPCIASRTSFDIEPIAHHSSVGASSKINPRVESGYRFNNIAAPVDHILDVLKPLSEPTRVTRFKSCLCFYDGEMEVFDYGECDCDIYFSNSMRTFIPMAAAINNICKTMQLTFGLEYEKWLREKVRDATNGYGGDASVKLRDRVLKEGKVLPNNIIDVSAFMDSMVDVTLMEVCGKELAERFMKEKPSKILTVATTGLVIALPMAKYLQVPVVYARKERNVVMADTYQALYSSKTVGKNRELLVSKKHIDPRDRILIIDDFLSSGASQEALLRIVSDAGATSVGVGVVLEKEYESGRQSLSGFNVPIHSLCRVASVKGGVIQLVEEEGFNLM